MKYLFIVFILISFGCKKSFLELTDTATLNKQSYVTDLRSMEHFMNGIHANVSRNYLRDLGAAYADVISDNLKPNLTKSPPSLLAHYSWSQQAEDNQESVVSRTSTAMNGEWKTTYLDIRSCNYVIETVDKYKKEDEIKANRFKGQAYALRALMHLKLANIFAQAYQFTNDASHIGIPYITTSDITATYKRQSVSEVYNNLVEDLNQAINLLPEETTDTRFMNRLAAKALLARVYLYMGNNDAAKKTALEVTAKVPLMSISAGYPVGLFKNLPPQQSETLYQLSPVFNTGSVEVRVIFISSPLKGLVFFATNDIANILNENPDDIRLQWVTNTTDGWQVKKFPEGVAGGIYPSPLFDYYPPVIRSSEMFLTVAESAAKTGDENTARSYLNKIRERANPAISLVTATGPALLDSIYKERRKELCFEGFRMYDIQRLKQPVEREDAAMPSVISLPYPSSKAIAPIPRQDVTIAGITQNKDY